MRNGNKVIAEFMGWYIRISTSDKYPNQEWHRSMNKLIEGEWCSGNCVLLDKPNVKEERIKSDEALWDDLCKHEFSRCGKYITSWDALIPVINKIKEIDDVKISELEEITNNLVQLNIEATYYSVISFIKKHKNR